MEEANPERDDTFDNFNTRKFLDVPTDRFYNEQLEQEHYLRETKRKKARVRTEHIDETE